MKFVLLTIGILALTACNHETPVLLHDIQGNTVQLPNKQAQWLVINYWAGWCKPCYEEIPELNALYQAHKKQGDVLVLGVNFEQLPKESLKNLIAKLAIQYPVLSSDPAKQLGIKEVANLPATYIISPEGKLINSLFGKQTKQSLEQAVEAAKKTCNSKATHFSDKPVHP